MSLQLILGGSGAGKTQYLFGRIIDASIRYPKQQYLVIVPEQFTMQTQKDIVMMHPQHGTMNIDVVSFQRLAYRIFEELAISQIPVLDDMGKAMILRKVLANHKKELGLYQGHLSQNGFINQVKSMVSEFYQYGITPEKLDGLAAEAVTPLLKQKLKDFALIFAYFQEYIAGHFITAEEILDVLCRVLPDSEIIKKSIIALDGYTGFTPVQYRLLELCLVHARQVFVTATVGRQVNPYQNRGIHSLFYMSCHMVRRLTALAEGQQVKKNQDIILSENPYPRFQESPNLAVLEERLFRYGATAVAQDPSADDGQIVIYRAVNPALEIQNLVQRIQYLIQDEGFCYRDIAVITGDMAGYGKEISHQFEQEQIPFFMDDKKSILKNTMVELVRAAFDVMQQNFSYESVFRCLKTGLITEDTDMLARMENYVLALGIRGAARWKANWERVYRGGANLNLEELNAFRDQVMAPLFDLQENLAEKDSTVSQMAEALATFLEQCFVQEKLAMQKLVFEAAGEYSLAKEYEQVYDLVFDLLERLVQLLGTEVLSRKEFAEILDAGFGEISVGVIPATVDRVVVGDITRTRLNHIKVLFLVGVNDGIIPSRKGSGSLLSDREREFLGQQELALAPTAKEDSFMQRFYLYLMMTKPTKRLMLSYARVTADGKSQRPSYLIGELQKTFPNLSIRDIQEEEGDSWQFAKLYSVREAKQALIKGLRQYDLVADKTEFQELYRFLLSSEQHQEELRKLVEAAFFSYQDQGIGKAVARALYGNILSGSVTRLEQYAACAYAHFLKYGLELTERPKYELAAVDMGNLFHNSIDLCFQAVKEQGLNWIELGDEEREQLVIQCVETVTNEYGNTIMQSSARNQWLVRRVQKITSRTVWALQEQIRKGDFQPAGFEVSFSSIDNLKAMKIALSEEESMHLRGRIDRLDLCEDEQHVYVKIIDYKSGGTSFDLAALYYGLQLQLVVYLDAVLELEKRKTPVKEVVPAGIFYYNINDPLVSRTDGMEQEDIEQDILRQLRMNGLVNSELDVIRHMDREIETESQVIPVTMKNGLIQEARSSVATRERFENLQTYVYETMKTAGRNILAGDTSVKPYQSGSRTACDYCPYHAVCRFERKLDGYDYHRLKEQKSEEIWGQIEATGEKG